MKHKVAFSGVAAIIFGLAALTVPTVASASPIDYRAVIQVQNSSSMSLGYLTNDPSYWTPQLSNDINNALIVDFTLDGTSGTAINLTTENSTETGFSYFGLVQGRDSTSSDIGPGNFNYLYLDNTNATSPNSTPQLVGNYFSANTGVNHTSESAVWTIDVTTGTLVPVWVNSDGTTPTTQVFLQSNHVYAGGDASAFNSRFPAPVTSATHHLNILSAVPETTAVPEPTSLWTLTLGVFGVGMLRRGTRSKCR